MIAENAWAGAVPKAKVKARPGAVPTTLNAAELPVNAGAIKENEV